MPLILRNLKYEAERYEAFNLLDNYDKDNGTKLSLDYINFFYSVDKDRVVKIAQIAIELHSIDSDFVSAQILRRIDLYFNVHNFEKPLFNAFKLLHELGCKTILKNELSKTSSYLLDGLRILDKYPALVNKDFLESLFKIQPDNLSAIWDFIDNTRIKMDPPRIDIKRAIYDLEYAEIRERSDISWNEIEESPRSYQILRELNFLAKRNNRYNDNLTEGKVFLVISAVVTIAAIGTVVTSGYMFAHLTVLPLAAAFIGILGFIATVFSALDVIINYSNLCDNNKEIVDLDKKISSLRP